MLAPPLTLINLYQPKVKKATIPFNYYFGQQVPTQITIPNMAPFLGVSFDLDLSTLSSQSNTFGVPKSLSFSLFWTPSVDGVSYTVQPFVIYIFDTQQVIQLRPWVTNTLFPGNSSGQGENPTQLVMTGCVPIVTGSTGLIARIASPVDISATGVLSSGASARGFFNLNNFTQPAWMTTSS